MSLSKKQISRAGDVLRQIDLPAAEQHAAMSVLGQWRAEHQPAMKSVRDALDTRCSHIRKRYLIAQRLKRTPSIVRKLRRFSGMQMARMQDIAGVRVIFPKIHDVYALFSTIQGGFPHELAHPAHDYIDQPKADGYRSIHQVVRHSSGYCVEIQIRTELEHAWATAVEVMGTIENQSIKTGEGSEGVRRFFVLASALFAKVEDTPLPPDCEGDIAAELKELDAKLHILSRLAGVTTMVEGQGGREKGGYYVIALSGEESSITHFTEKQFDRAQAMYTALEENSSADEDVVLVSAGSLHDVKQAYPNYFLDTKKFINSVQRCTRVRA